MRIAISVLIFVFLMFMSSCQHHTSKNLQNVGMLMDGLIEDNEWNVRGYEGLKRVQDNFDAEVFLKEDVKSKHEIMDAVEELDDKGVNLIFGHSYDYGKVFVDVAKMYPHIHFVYHNGGYFRENVTSLNVDLHAMGFFSGMIAGMMTNTNDVGIIAASDWQPEIEGFYEGVKYENPAAIVHINYADGWNVDEVGLLLYDQMREENVDVIYPTSFSFSKEIVKQAIQDDIYAIGYFLNEENFDEETVLTSTIQHIDSLYEQTAKQFNEGLLKGDIYVYDFSEEVISFGSFSPKVPEEFKQRLRNYISEYEETNLLPNEEQKRNEN